jgi:hypothetical protein
MGYTATETSSVHTEPEYDDKRQADNETGILQSVPTTPMV